MDQRHVDRRAILVALLASTAMAAMPLSARIPEQFYQGALNMIGLNIGISAGGILGWAVLAPTGGVPQGALAGEYVGASGDIGLGVGAGANVLVGGSGRSYALQPVSLEGSISVKIAVGVSALKLRSAM
jgi:ABC-type amino acid transport substrate-binding protein